MNLCQNNIKIMSKIFGFGSRLNNLTVGAKTLLAGAGLLTSVNTQAASTNHQVNNLLEVTRECSPSMPSLPSYRLREVTSFDVTEPVEYTSIDADEPESLIDAKSRIYANGRVLNNRPQRVDKDSSMDVIGFCKNLESLELNDVVTGVIEKCTNLRGYVYEYFKSQMQAHKSFLLSVRSEMPSSELKENFEKSLEEVLEISFEEIKVANVESEVGSFQKEINDLVLKPDFNNLESLIQKVTSQNDIVIEQIEDPILKKAVESKSISLFALSYIRSILASNFDPESPNFLSILRPNSTRGKENLLSITEVLSYIDNSDNEKLVKGLLLDSKKMNFLPSKLADSGLFTQRLSQFLNAYINLGEPKNQKSQIDLTVLSILYSTKHFPESNFSKNVSSENKAKAIRYIRSNSELTQAASGILS